jgi:hypothetical protein
LGDYQSLNKDADDVFEEKRLSCYLLTGSRLSVKIAVSF